jgi:RNA 2',3'-cyclic 3'-phosphodiesterase
MGGTGTIPDAAPSRKEKHPQLAAIRSFIAIPLPPALRKRLGSLQQELQQRIPEMRPTALENLHLTLLFLGDQPPETLEAIGCLLLATGRSCPTFSLRLHRLGRFPPRGRPRVIWLGVQTPSPLTALHATLREDLLRFGLHLDTQSFRPHLTLGRLGTHPMEPPLQEPLGERDYGYLRVESLVLFSSRLTKNGAVHQPLLKVPLGG